MKFGFKSRNCVSKTRNSAFKMSNFAALLVLKTESLSRTTAQLSMLHKYLSSMDLFEVMELGTDLRQKQCCRYIRAERYAAGDVIFEEGSLAWDVYLLRGICMHNKSHNLPLILGLNHAYIFPARRYMIIEGVVSIRKDGVEVSKNDEFCSRKREILQLQ